MFGQVRSGDYDTGAGTSVRLSCLANGTTKKIADVRVGDSVLATDPATGKTSARTVTATMSHDDNDLLDLTVRDGDGHEGVLKTTDHHKIWDVSRNAWVLAADLAVGDQLRQDDGTNSSVVTLTHRPGHGQMLDLTVEIDHTFYVLAGDTSVLVHNVGCDQWADQFIENYGGKKVTFTPPEGDPIFPDGSYADQPPGEWWAHHTVAVRGNLVFDQFHPDGISIADYKALWKDADKINFGF